jgi:hypothetical protein
MKFKSLALLLSASGEERRQRLPKGTTYGHHVLEFRFDRTKSNQLEVVDSVAVENKRDIPQQTF